MRNIYNSLLNFFKTNVNKVVIGIFTLFITSGAIKAHKEVNHHELFGLFETNFDSPEMVLSSVMLIASIALAFGMLYSVVHFIITKKNK